MANFNINGFMQNKSVLPSYKFDGEFREGAKIFSQIEPWHIRSVTFEQHTFKHEGQYHGPGILNTFPVLDRAENGAYKLTIVMEEDEKGTIFEFIEYLKQKIIKSNGVYNSISEMKDLTFQITLHTMPYKRRILFENVYFQSAEGSESSYSSSEMKIYTLNLVYENYSSKEIYNSDYNYKMVNAKDGTAPSLPKNGNNPSHVILKNSYVQNGVITPPSNGYFEDTSVKIKPTQNVTKIPDNGLFD